MPDLTPDEQVAGYQRLTRVCVDGLFGRHNIDLDLEPGEGGSDRLRIIFDDNGQGKTTVLKAVYHLLSWVDLDLHLTALAELPVEGVQLQVGETLVEFLRDPDDPRTCLVRVVSGGGGGIELHFDPTREDPRPPSRLVLDRSDVARDRETLSRVCRPPIFVSDDRAIRGDDLLSVRRTRSRAITPTEAKRLQSREPRLERSDPSQELRNVLEALSQLFLREAYQSRSSPQTDGFYADVVSRIAKGQASSRELDIASLRSRALEVESSLHLPEKYGLVNLSQLRQVKDTLSGLRRNSANKRQIATVLEPFFSTLEADAENLRPVAGRIDTLVSTANSYLNDKAMSYSPGDGLTISPEPLEGEEPLDADQLSSGERHLLLLFGSSMIAEGRRIILIDEPELSLGIQWKRRLLSSLLELTEESEAQFLVASHSVEIIAPHQASAVSLRDPS